jgi:hypothetical protein
MAAVVVGASILAMAFSTNDAAGQAAPPCDSTATATPEEGVIRAFGLTVTPTATCTPVTIVRSATPTITATVPATNTPVPPTEEPATSTPVPPTATIPSGGAAGGGVQPPSTGSGPAGVAPVNWLAVGAATMLVLGGSGSLAAGVRRRR